VSGYSGDAGDAMAGTTNSPYFNNDGMMFTTVDSDNDACPYNCAEELSNGWWYNWCSSSVLNFDVRNSVWEINSEVSDVQASRMLVKHN